MQLSERQKLILHILIKDYVKNAQAVSSGLLVRKYKLDISPATVRNELMVLEELGYIYQPHTSAGRVPTALAYALDLKTSFDRVKDLKQADLLVLNRAWEKSNDDYKPMARSLADLSSNAVFWAFHKNDLYHTGLSNLFSQVEFKHSDVVCDASQVIDRMEDIIDSFFDGLENGLKVFLGNDNPFGAFLGTIILKYHLNNISGLVGILGPIRMDYHRNLSLLEYLNDKFK
ncbi:MAG: hypothetical protein EOM88_02035 [Clostridia bacterium]|nr:hypothetical protein [Clostridia bacterium]